MKSGIFATGTLKVGKQGVPPEVKQLKAVLESKKVPRGTGYYYQQPSSPLIYCCWKDSMMVTVASTRYQGHSRDTIQRRLADHNTNRPTQVDIAISEAIHQYNKYMGGADKSNQYPSYHLVHRQTPRYWKTLFFHFVDIAVNNAFILHNWSRMENKQKPTTENKFQDALVQEILSLPTSQQLTSQPSATQSPQLQPSQTQSSCISHPTGV